MTPALAAMAADIAPPAQRATVISYTRQASDSAFLVGPLLYGALADACTPGHSIYASAAISAAALATFYVRGKETLRSKT